MLTTLRGLVIAVIVGCLPADGFAQSVVHIWNELDQSDLSTVNVFDDSGAAWRGNVLSLDTDGLDIMVARMGQARHFDVSQIVRLEKVGLDSFKDGIWKGGGIGGGVGLLAALATDLPIGISTVTAFYGGLMGFIFDAVLRHEESVTIYEAPRGQVTRQDPFDRRGQGKSIMLNATVSF